MVSVLIDVVLDRGHAQREELQSVVNQAGGALSSVDTAGCWGDAIAAGQAEWIVLVDRGSQVAAADLRSLTVLLEAVQKPVWMQPWSSSGAGLRLVHHHCPAAVSLCWGHPAEHFAVCVRRVSLETLPTFHEDHAEVIWDWLIRSVPLAIGAGNIAVTDAANNVGADAGSIRYAAPPSLVSSSPAPEQGWLIDHIQRSKPSQFVPEKCSEADAVAVKAGLLLWHDAAEASHQLSQSVEGLGTHQAGDYWHAILHRREPDYSNAKYWFRLVGTHSVFSELVPHAARILNGVAEEPAWKSRLCGRGTWDPFAFVDLCETCAGHEDSSLGMAARQIQAVEMQLLMVSTYCDASGMKV